MIITPEKIIESKITLTNDEYETLVDYKILLEKMRFTMVSKDIKAAAGISCEFLTAEINTVIKIMDRVEV